MQFLRSPLLAIALGAFVCAMLAILGARITAPALIAPMAAQASAAIAEAGPATSPATGVEARFISPNGWPSRHPVLHGGEELATPMRAQIARAVAAVPGVAGVSWSDGDMLAESAAPILNPMHCQEDVQALLRARTIRFEEGSARIDAASGELVDEVAAALSPCLGAIIAITGHTDRTGPEPGNLALSRERAEAVRSALMQRGIPADGLRARGVGSARPVEGLPAEDPANRRIDFLVLQTDPIVPTPVDTPSPK